jgi:glucose-6-phosphate isomerase
MENPLWQRYCDWLYHHAELGLYLDVSRIPFPDTLVATLTPAFAKAFADMAALEAGAIANPDENRMVGHYWLRAPELAPSPELQRAIEETVERIERFAALVHAGTIRPPAASRFTEALNIGIGGSALGPQFVDQALAPDAPPLHLHFLDNTDPDGIDRLLARLGDKLDRTLVINTSKSGGTPETANGTAEMRHAFQQRGLDFAKHAVAVTGAGSRLAQQALAEGWLDIFPMEDWVGGRTSEMSAVGLLPAALQGIAIREMLAGAQIMDRATRVPMIRQNPAALLALCWYFEGNGRGEKDMVVLPYKDRLALLSRYLQQLVMESLGKEKDLAGNVVHQGIAVYGNKGSTDQHAYVQQLREGIPNFFVTFIEVLRDAHHPHPELSPNMTAGDYLNGFLWGTRQALYDNDRHSLTLTLPDVTPKTVGATIALFERAVGFYASLVGINAYHQPGVEAGKQAAAAILHLQAALLNLLADGQSRAIEEVAIAIGQPAAVETLYGIARHLVANGRLAVTGDPAQPRGLRFHRA